MTSLCAALFVDIPAPFTSKFSRLLAVNSEKPTANSQIANCYCTSNCYIFKFSNWPLTSLCAALFVDIPALVMFGICEPLGMTQRRSAFHLQIVSSSNFQIIFLTRFRQENWIDAMTSLVAHCLLVQVKFSANKKIRIMKTFTLSYFLCSPVRSMLSRLSSTRSTAQEVTPEQFTRMTLSSSLTLAVHRLASPVGACSMLQLPPRVAGKSHH